MNERISLYLLLSRWAQAFLPVNQTAPHNNLLRSPRTALWTFPSSCLLEKIWSSSIKLRIWASIFLCSTHIIQLEHSSRRSTEGDSETANGKSGFVMCQSLSIFRWRQFFKLEHDCGCFIVHNSPSSFLPTPTRSYTLAARHLTLSTPLPSLQRRNRSMLGTFLHLGHGLYILNSRRAPPVLCYVSGFRCWCLLVSEELAALVDPLLIPPIIVKLEWIAT